ncbi:MAG: RdgB/HAM1 family non-canonical purine NTP pyrophosphatase [Candidatus Diapherotrites archaeon]|uniref:RdgB/HAM1 family non-canonical purine NTP pyrophosphatase n=1 Tax=Candidatus Iainarchaeum sp. TaxID=3101447 RepID=A0A938YNU7_9ARCH|nr:RdgB/HAM1 family non-canonical purine NTP pyrophosphatase [Candidatus Diapherotrites archaeon]
MLTFATGNSHKFQEIKAICQEYGIELRQEKLELEEISSLDAKKIALHKARQAFEILKQPLIAEDTGFYFKAFKGFPGTMPKRVYESIGYAGILKLLKGENREAYSQCTICLMESPENYKFFEGRLEGSITEKVVKPKADVMPYERIFTPQGYKKAMGELSRKEKNEISHRAIAARKMAEWLKEKAIHGLVDSI